MNKTNDNYSRLSVSPCFARHLKSAIECGECLGCGDLSRLTPLSGGLCRDCGSKVHEDVKTAVRANFLISVQITEKTNQSMLGV